MIRLLLLVLTLLLAPAALPAQQPQTPRKTTRAATRAPQKKKTPARRPATPRKRTPAAGKSRPQVAVTPQIRKLQDESAALRKQISESETLLRSNKKNVSAGLSNLHLLNSQIGQQQRYVAGIESETRALAAEIDTLGSRLRALEADLARCKQQYNRALMYMFRNRVGQSKWTFVFKAKSYRELYRRMRYVTEYGRYQRAQGEVIRKKEDTVALRRAELEGTQREKQRLLSEGRTEQRKLEGQKEERTRMVAELQQQQKKLQSVLADQRKKQQSLNARIDALIQQEIAKAERRRREEEARQRAEAERRRREAQQQAAERARAARAPKTAKSARKSPAGESESRAASLKFRAEDTADRALSADFAANRGRLPVPITGPYSITARYGQYNVEGLSGVQLDNKGINLTGRQGAQARSIFGGTVTAVFPFGGMYNVIVRHGSYISVYCNLARCSVRNGQKVAARQTLGAVAADAAGNCTLHFQLRKETSKLNPEQWIAR